MEVKDSKETQIDIKKLPGEPVEIDLGQVEEVEGEFHTEYINAPEDCSFDFQACNAVVEGFTEGALKNIITLSKKKIRLYKVTEESIKLLSCSDLPPDTPYMSAPTFFVDKKIVHFKH